MSINYFSHLQPDDTAPLHIGDRVRIVIVPGAVYGGSIGFIKKITENGDYLVIFSEDITAGYDRDMLVKVAS